MSKYRLELEEDEARLLVRLVTWGITRGDIITQRDYKPAAGAGVLSKTLDLAGGIVNA